MTRDPCCINMMVPSTKPTFVGRTQKCLDNLRKSAIVASHNSSLWASALLTSRGYPSMIQVFDDELSGVCMTSNWQKKLGVLHYKIQKSESKWVPEISEMDFTASPPRSDKITLENINCLLNLQELLN